MIIIADSGSSKTDWRLIESASKISQLQTVGLNPYHMSLDDIAIVIEPIVAATTGEAVQVVFYGAGCTPGEKSESLVKLFRQAFATTEVEVHNDLLGAARACTNQKGTVAILGTGANAASFDGENLLEKSPSLGYILGDEGSGAILGQKLLKTFLYGSLPTKLQEAFVQEYPETDLLNILNQVYREPNANRYLASFCTFLGKHQNDPFIYRLLFDSFTEFIETHLRKLDPNCIHPVHACGSIAFYFSNILRKAITKAGYSVGNIIESPIAGLTLYHLNYE